MGDNDFAVEHTGVRKRQREGTLEKVVKYDKEAFERVGIFAPDTNRRFFSPQVSWL